MYYQLIYILICYKSNFQLFKKVWENGIAGTKKYNFLERFSENGLRIFGLWERFNLLLLNNI